MKKVYLHIGAGKTGSSALQSHLVNNYEPLLKHGYYYPKAANDLISKNFGVTSGNARKLKINLCINYDPSELFKQIKEYVNDAKGKDIVLSNEGLSRYNAANAEHLKLLFNKLGYEVYIVSYIRAIADHCLSSYHQGIKGKCETGTFVDYIHIYENRFLDIIQKNIETFGRDKSIFINYDKIKVNIFEDFLLNVLRINNLDEFKFYDKKVNRSLTDYEVSMMKHFNLLFNADKKSICFKNILVNPYKNTTVFISDSLLTQSLDLTDAPSITSECLDLIVRRYQKDVAKINALLPRIDLEVCSKLNIVDELKEIKLNDFERATISILAAIVKKIDTPAFNGGKMNRKVDVTYMSKLAAIFKKIVKPLRII